MAINKLHDFLYSYFTAHHCQIVENTNGMLKIQLTEAMDRVLMNRPFYWHYVKKMGYAGDPMQLTLITDPEKRDGKNEWIHFGSPRLQQILQHLNQHEKYAKLFEKVETDKQTPLYPWLVINIKISYQGENKKDEIFSIGLHLINGAMKLEMMEYLQDKSLQTMIADYCYTLSPIIKLHSGFKRIESVLDNYIQKQEHEWAKSALQRMEEEKQLLKHFYKSDQNEAEVQTEMNKEIAEIERRYKPSITYEVINGGLFYLTEQKIR